MPINELGQTVNEKGNILCQKIGTKKTVHLSPHMVRNAELMSKQGWEVVLKPEAPPRLGKNVYSASSYDEKKNQEEALKTNDPQPEYKLNPEKGEITFNEPPVNGASINLTENNIPVVESESDQTGNPGTNKPLPNKRGRKPGTKIVKKVTQDKPSNKLKSKEKVNG